MIVGAYHRLRAASATMRAVRKAGQHVRDLERLRAVLAREWESPGPDRAADRAPGPVCES
jgi:hypothetical protein